MPDESMQIILAWASRSTMGAPAEIEVGTTQEQSVTIRSECYSCAHARQLPGDCHIACTSPDEQMTVSPHGFRHGWAHYPMNYDPVWKTRACRFHAPTNEKEQQR